MERADFIHLVRMSEIASAEDSRAYRRSVAAFAVLGYAWVLGCLALAARPLPVGPYGAMRRLLALPPEPAFAQDALHRAVQRIGGVDDTPPVLRGRVEALTGGRPTLPPWSARCSPPWRATMRARRWSWRACRAGWTRRRPCSRCTSACCSATQAMPRRCWTCRAARWCSRPGMPRRWEIERQAFEPVH